jgi:hypothetical protein
MKGLGRIQATYGQRFENSQKKVESLLDFILELL